MKGYRRIFSRFEKLDVARPLKKRNIPSGHPIAAALIGYRAGSVTIRHESLPGVVSESTSFD
jgi:hypothetical protein